LSSYWAKEGISELRLKPAKLSRNQMRLTQGAEGAKEIFQNRLKTLRFAFLGELCAPQENWFVPTGLKITLFSAEGS
jgi:hypothetical protein